MHPMAKPSTPSAYIEVSLEGYPVKWSSGSEVMSATVTLGQGEKSSSCSVTLADPGSKIASDLIRHTLEAGGIPKLPDAKESKKEDTSANPASGSSQAVAAGDTSLTPFRKAFLDTIAYSEGTWQKGDNGYNIMVGGTTFSSYADHPRVRKNLGGGLISSAAGRYQIIDETWDGIKRALKLPDFSPASQDRAAIYLIGVVRKALGAVDANKFETAIGLCRKEWASFPGAGYNQHENGMSKLKEFYLGRLKVYGVWGGQQVFDKAEPVPTTPSAKSSETTVAPVAEIVKGSKLTVSIGDQSFEFYHQGTEAKEDGTSVLTGQGIRWVLNRRKRNKTAQNIKLSELATQVATAHGVSLDYKASLDLSYEHIDQSGISDYQLLRRECDKAGLFISELTKGSALTIKSLRDIRETALIVQPGANLLSYSIKDTAVDASSEDAGSSLLQGEDKIRLNPVTGQFEQIKPDVDPVKDKSVTGKDKGNGSGKLQPGQEAIADQSRARVKRVKGLPSSFTVVLDTITLGLQPLDAIRSKGLPGVLSRIWLVDSVTHSPKEGTTVIECYSPVEVLDSSPATPEASSTPSSAPAVNPGGFIWGAHGAITSPFGYRIHPISGTRKMHRGTDIAAPANTECYAAAAGVVTALMSPGQSGGGGNVVVLKHSNGYQTLYMHLNAFKVSQGQSVQQGQVIGLMGSTGGSTGVHLHFEIRDPTNKAVPPEAVGLQAVKKGSRV